MKKRVTMLFAVAAMSAFAGVSEKKNVTVPGEKIKPAVSAENKKLAEEMLMLSDTPQMIKQINERIIKMQDRMLQQRMKSKEEQQKAEVYKKKVAALLAENVSWEKMKDSFIKLYSKTYTPEEMQSISAFLKTPAGQKMIKHQQELMGQSMLIVQQGMRKVMPELRKLQQELMPRKPRMSRPKARTTAVKPPVATAKPTVAPVEVKNENLPATDKKTAPVQKNEAKSK